MAMISRRKIISRSQSELDYSHGVYEIEEDVWFNKDKLFQVRVYVIRVVRRNCLCVCERRAHIVSRQLPPPSPLPTSLSLHLQLPHAPALTRALFSFLHMHSLPFYTQRLPTPHPLPHPLLLSTTAGSHHGNTAEMGSNRR